MFRAPAQASPRPRRLAAWKQRSSSGNWLRLAQQGRRQTGRIPSDALETAVGQAKLGLFCTGAWNTPPGLAWRPGNGGRAAELGSFSQGVGPHARPMVREGRSGSENWVSFAQRGGRRTSRIPSCGPGTEIGQGKLGSFGATWQGSGRRTGRGAWAGLVGPSGCSATNMVVGYAPSVSVSPVASGAAGTFFSGRGPLRQRPHTRPGPPARARTFLPATSSI